MDTPYYPVALRLSTIGPVHHRRRPTAACWSEFAARLRDCTEADAARVTALRQTAASGLYVSDAVAIAHRMLAALSTRRH